MKTQARPRKNGSINEKGYVLVALAAVLVLALGGTAMAKGYSPGNRSSSYLAKGESYIEWDDAQAKMAAAGVSAEATASVHGNYSTTTVKCQVCHSAHKAAATGDTLLQSTAAQACVPCHLGATATSNLKVSAGNRHGEATDCTNGYCHSIAPHGAGDISKYATLKTAMLTNHADSLLDAAIAAGSRCPCRGQHLRRRRRQGYGNAACHNRRQEPRRHRCTARTTSAPPPRSHLVARWVPAMCAPTVVAT